MPGFWLAELTSLLLSLGALLAAVLYGRAVYDWYWLQCDRSLREDHPDVVAAARSALRAIWTMFALIVLAGLFQMLAIGLAATDAKKRNTAEPSATMDGHGQTPHQAASTNTATAGGNAAAGTGDDLRLGPA